MRRYLLVLVWIAHLLPLSTTVRAQTVYFRPLGDANNCLVKGTNNSSPDRIECYSAVPFSIGDRLVCANVYGDTAPNRDDLKVASVSNPSGGPYTFTITDQAGTPIAGSGTWKNGDYAVNGQVGTAQICGKVQPYTLKSRPFLWTDPTGLSGIEMAAKVSNGLLTNITVAGGIPTVHYAVSIADTNIHTCTNCFAIYGSATSALNTAYGATAYSITAVGSNTVTLSSTGAANGTYSNSALTASAWAYAANPTWDAITNSRFDTQWGYFYSATPASPAAMAGGNFYEFESMAVRCYINELDTNACTGALWGIRNFDVVLLTGTFAQKEGGAIDDAQEVDYETRVAGDLARTYELLAAIGKLSAGDKTTFNNKVWTHSMPAGQTCSKATRVEGSGTVAITANGAGNPYTITGTGTHFLSEVPVGYVLDYGSSHPLLYNLGKCRVTSVTSDTLATCQPSSFGSVQGAYSIKQPFASGQCGYYFYQGYQLGSSWPGQPDQQPPAGATVSLPWTNQAFSRMGGFLELGLAACADDPRACYAAEANEQFWMDYMLPPMINAVTGDMGYGTNYQYSIGAWSWNQTALAVKFALVNGPDVVGSDAFAKSQWGDWHRYLQPPGLPAPNDAFRNFTARYPICYGTTCNPVGHGFDPHSDLTFGDSLLTFLALNPKGTSQQKFNYWLKNSTTYWPAAWNGSASKGLWFENSYPTMQATNFSSDPTGKLFAPTAAQYTQCVAQGQAPWQAPCYQKVGNNYVVSRTGWDLSSTSQDTMLMLYGPPSTVERQPMRAGETYLWKGDELISSSDYGRNNRAFVDYNNQYSQWQIGTNLQMATVNAVNLTNFYHGNTRTYPGYGINYPNFDRFATSDVAGHKYTYAHLDCSTCVRTGLANNITREWFHAKTGNEYTFMYSYFDTSSTPTSIFGDFVHYAQNGEAFEGTTSCPGAGGCAALATNGGEILSLSTKSGVHSKFVPIGNSFPFVEYPGVGNDWSFWNETDDLASNGTRSYTLHAPMSATGSMAMTPVIGAKIAGKVSATQTSGPAGGPAKQWYWTQASSPSPGVRSDLATTNGDSNTCTVSSASYTFTSADIGRIVMITGLPDGNYYWTGGPRTITGIAGKNAILNSKCNNNNAPVAQQGYWSLWDASSFQLTQDASQTPLRSIQTGNDLSSANGLGSLVSFDTLSAAITSVPAAGTNENISVTSGAGVFNTTVITIDSEQMLVQNDYLGTGGLLNIQRGYNGTTPTVHSNGAAIKQMACTIHSGTVSFVPVDIRGYMHVSSGTNWTPDYYFIVNVHSGDADVIVNKSLRSSCGTANSLSGGMFQTTADSAQVTYTTMSSGTIGGGHSFRVAGCAGSGGVCDPAATKYEMIQVHRPFYGTTDPGISVTSLNPDANWTGVQTEDKVVLFSRGGTTHATISGFTTTHTGTAEYLFAGLPAGSYTVTVNGSPVTGSPFTVDATAQSLEFASTAGLVSVNGLPQMCQIISTSPLPGGSVSFSYNQTIATSNCVGPVSWSVISGSLCNGQLSLNSSTGAITGTPSTGQICNFTLQAVDAATPTPTTVSAAFQITVSGGSSGSGTLTVAPATLSFSCIAGGADPASQNIAVSETGGTLDQFSAVKTQPWLSLSPTSGGAAGNVAVSVTGCAGLTPGTVTDTVTISSTTAGITGTPGSVGVSLVVAAPPSPASKISGNATASGSVVVH